MPREMKGVLDHVVRACKERGAILTDDHVVLTKKPDGYYHAPGYFDKDRVLSDAVAIDGIGAIFADHFGEKGIQVVVGPTCGAVGLAAVTAVNLMQMTCQPVDWVYAEEATEKLMVRECNEGTNELEPPREISVVSAGQRVIRRCFPQFVRGRRCLIAEDVFSSGGSAKATIAAVENVGGIVAGVAVICNRSGITAADLGVPDLQVIFDIPMVMHKEETCPLCAELKPINMRVGHGADFFVRHPGSNVPRSAY